MLDPTNEERLVRTNVIRAIADAVQSNTTIRLPSPHGPTAPDSYRGTIGAYTYQFEGEDDLLHLIVAKKDGGILSAEEGQDVAAFLLPGLPPGLVWIRPGEFSQHFYCGHDDLVAHVTA